MARGLFVTLVTAVGVTNAFMPGPMARETVRMAAESRTSRREAVEKALGVGALLGVVALPKASNAGWLNADKLPEVIKPKDAIIDQDILASGEVQEQLKNIKNYRTLVGSLRSDLERNPQADLLSRVSREFDFSGLRDSLNKVNTVFSEDTQRGTDRLVRIILQDVAELEQASRQRPGVERSQNKLTRINKKLTKLEGAFSELLTYF